MLKLKAFWTYISESGCNGESLDPEVKRIRLTNQSSLILFLLIMIYVPILAGFGHAFLAFLTALVALLFLLIPVAHRIFMGQPWIRYGFLLLNYSSVSTYSLIIGRDSGIHLFFVSAIATPFVVLDIRHKSKAFFFASIPILLVLFLELYGYCHFPGLPFEPEALHILYLMVLPSACLTTFLFSGYFYIVNQKSEEKLHQTIRDLNHSRQMVEDQNLKLATASRLSAIGELSGSIAHEINNPLAIIQGYTEHISRLVQYQDIDRDRLTQACDKIIKTINRITKIIMGLRKLSREGEDDPMEQSDLCEIIDDATSVCLEGLYHLGIELRIMRPEDPCLCYCRPLQISQVLLNLIQNAKDAVHDLEEKWISVEIRQNATHNEIVIKDSGQITNAEILAKIGQPFFTTKAPGKGTGLGLSISSKILAAHSGSITIDKEAATTTFIVQLPRDFQT